MIPRPILHLQKQRDPRVAAWILRLNKCEPRSPAARAVYAEAADAGLVRALSDGLQLAAAADQTEAALLKAEMQARWGSK